MIYNRRTRVRAENRWRGECVRVAGTGESCCGPPRRLHTVGLGPGFRPGTEARPVSSVLEHARVGQE